MIIRHDLRLIFLHVPKCAGKELREIFKTGSDSKSIESYFNFEYSAKLRRHVDLAHLPLDDLTHYPAYQLLNCYKVIAVTRNPYERLRSAINEYCRQFSREDEQIANQVGPTMSARLSYLREIPIRHSLRDPRYIHSMPMHWFTHYGQQPKAHYLLRCETLKDDFLRLANDLKLPESMHALARHTIKNQSPIDGCDFTAGLTPGEIAMANLLYQQDFQIFDYPLKNETPTRAGPLAETLATLDPLERHSHSISLLDRASTVEWHWGPVSEIPPTRYIPATRSDASS